MVKERGRKEVDIEWNGQKGKLVLVADLKAGPLQAIIRNVLRLPPLAEFETVSIENIDYVEYIVQMAQKLIKQAPTGFDINKPDNIRDLDPEDWAAIEDFVGEHYPIMTFLGRGMFVLFGKKSPEQNSVPKTDST